MDRRFLVLSFGAGTAVMAAEIAASRLVAPFFGSSTPVWALLIAFVLGALALGAERGGRWADRAQNVAPLVRALTCAAVMMAILPFAGRALLEPASRALLTGHALKAVGLTAVFAALAAPPVVVLGMVGPFLLRLGLLNVGSAGVLAGRISAAATAGSIVGTLIAAFAALPLLGTARTFAASALLLAVVVAPFATWSWRALGFAVPALALAAAPLALPRRADAIDAVESAYSFVQTLQDETGRRELVFDEAYAAQSIYQPGMPVTDQVFAHYALTPAMTAAPVAAPRILLLGLGAGTGARALLEAYPGASIVGVELDPEVVRQGRAHFDLPQQVEVHIGDARTFLVSESRHFDAVVIDAFRFPYVPFHLTTLEFDRLLREHLAPGGVVCMNLGRYGSDRTVMNAVAGTLAHVFPEVAGVDASNHSNTLLYASEPGLARRLLDAAPGLPEHLQPLARRVGRRLNRVAPAVPLTDDVAPIEFLTDATLARALWNTGGVL